MAAAKKAESVKSPVKVDGRRVAYTVVSTGASNVAWGIVVCCEGEEGYHGPLSDYGPYEDEARACGIAERLNERLHLTKKEAAVIVASTMPGAHRRRKAAQVKDRLKRAVKMHQCSIPQCLFPDCSGPAPVPLPELVSDLPGPELPWAAARQFSVGRNGHGDALGRGMVSAGVTRMFWHKGWGDAITLITDRSVLLSPQHARRLGLALVRLSSKCKKSNRKGSP